MSRDHRYRDRFAKIDVKGVKDRIARIRNYTIIRPRTRKYLYLDANPITYLKAAGFPIRGG